MSERLTLSQPESLGILDSELLSAVRQGAKTIPKQSQPPYPHSLGFKFRNGQLGFSVGTCDLRPFDPIVEPIQKTMSAIGLEPADNVRVTVDIQPVVPNVAQRVDYWHVDGTKKIITVTDNMPTEFLVGSLDQQAITKSGVSLQKAVHEILERTIGGPNLMGYVPEQEFEDYGLSIYRPEAYQVTAFDNQTIHRSAQNTSDQVIERTWMRFSIANAEPMGEAL